MNAMIQQFFLNFDTKTVTIVETHYYTFYKIESTM